MNKNIKTEEVTNMNYSIRVKGTIHAYERAEERLDYVNERANRLFERAWERGKRFTDYENGKSRNYLFKKCTAGVTAIFFGNDIFIYNNETMGCITCYKAPQWFGQKKRIKFHCNDVQNEFGIAA